MAFDKQTRNALSRMVTECRRLLTDDVHEQLQATYGIQPNGTALAVTKLAHLDDRGLDIARALREWLEHLFAGEAGTEEQRRKNAFFRMAQETAFTYLNRLAALRMCEERGLVIECVRRGMESDGFALYERLASQVLGDRGQTYRVFLECMFDELAVASEITGKPLRDDYETEQALQKDIPGLILKHNLHGIDIDPRACQIAALSLWLRAQRSYQKLGLKAAERPTITRSNIVCAEPMPGEEDLLRDFTATLNPPLLGQLVTAIFEKMKLAGEAGSLLKIEEDIRDSISAAKKQWSEQPKTKQLALFGQEEKEAKFEQQWLFDVSGITEEEFWETAEGLILTSLQRYAKHAGNGESVKRGLFQEDAEQGFAFIDICWKHYDVALMNPPFGDASLPSKPYIEDTYADTKGDVYKAFVECFQDRLVPTGMLGTISSRTGFFLGQSADWRERIVLRLYRPVTLTDFGSGVLDAMVETVAYVLRTLSNAEDRQLTLRLLPEVMEVPTDKNGCFSIPKYQKKRDGLKRHQAEGEIGRLLQADYVIEVPGHFRRFQPQDTSIRSAPAPQPESFDELMCFRLVDVEDKGGQLAEAIQSLPLAQTNLMTHVVNPTSFRKVPGAPFAYWVSERVRQLFTELPPFEGEGRTVKQGLATADDFRFVRAWWEVPPACLLDGANGPDWRQEPAVFQAWCRQRTLAGKRWVPFAKGGAYSPYYADLYLVVNWERDGEEIRRFIDPVTGRPYSRPQNTDFYFRPGLTWSDRTTSSFSARLWPAGGVFSVKGVASWV